MKASVGVRQERVAKEEEIKPALKLAEQTTDKPVVIDFLIEREANVFPMVPGGAGINEMLFEGGEKA